MNKIGPRQHNPRKRAVSLWLTKTNIERAQQMTSLGYTLSTAVDAILAAYFANTEQEQTR